jgi:uncharacterized coiled-coil DUF342 family protein
MRAPNWAGIEKWIEQASKSPRVNWDPLKDWVHKVKQTFEELENEADSRDGRLQQAEQERDEIRDRYDRLMDDLEDIPRGIRTLEEVMDRAAVVVE